MNTPAQSWTRPVLALVVATAALATAGYWWKTQHESATPPPSPAHAAPTTTPTADVSPREPAVESNTAATTAAPTSEQPERIEFPRDSWVAAEIKIQPATRAPLLQSVQLTGKITLNEDRIAHIFPLVEGRVDQVKVRFGDKVRQGDPLVIVQSQEVGRLMLQLFQDRIQRDFSITKDRWTQQVTANTLDMIKLMRDEVEISEVEEQLHNKTMGDYRDKLMTAYINLYKATKNLERVKPLSADGTITGRQLLEAESEWKGSRATLQSLIEQIQQDAAQTAAISSQSVKELQTRVAIDETNLKILGFEDSTLARIDPAQQGEAIAHYPINAPFDGTIISKDVVLLERVGPERQILSIADLSTVWVTTDIYEEHLSLLKDLKGQVIHLRSNAWPDKVFDATIFYSGDVVNDTTRTVSMRALADNSTGELKPGMFVDVELPSTQQSAVLQVPASAIQEYEGAKFVFVHVAKDSFERRDIKIGRRNQAAVEIVKGLAVDDPIVVSGGFALKSKMLSSLLSEE